ncbi:MAG: MarR family transcriptional regulator [Gammaproteobacteria bacterium]|nr:MarR family transcriptional regulator [Gammaproteobacteria bacterium]
MPVPDKSLMRGLLHAFYWCDEGLQKSMAAGGWPALSRTQSMIMVNLSDGVTRPSDLARAIGVSRQAIQRTLMEMERDGLIHLVPDPADGRAKIVEPSRDGRGIYASALRAIVVMEAELKRRFGKKAINDLRKLLYADWGPVVVATRSARSSRPMGPAPQRSRWRKSNV